MVEASLDEGGLLNRLWSFMSVQLAAWAIFLLNVVAWFKVRNERLRDVASEKGEDWVRVRDERDRYHTLLVKCQNDCNEWMGRAVKAEATLQGWGEVRQQLAIEDATLRIGHHGNGEGNGEGGENGG